MTTAARAAEDAADRKVLSKNVLQMKFMQKGKVIIVNEDDEMAKRIQRNKAHWVIGGIEDQPKMFPYEFDTSLVLCEGLLPIGRMAFSNFNQVVDKTHKEILRIAEGKPPIDSEEVEEISDGEMAQRYESLVQTIDKKFKGKRKHEDDDTTSDSESDEELRNLKKRAKRGFLKPKVE